MNEKNLFEHLTKNRGLDAAAEKLVKNAINYSQVFTEDKEKVLFLKNMLSGIYPKGQEPEFTTEVLNLEDRKLVRVKKIIHKHTISVVYKDIEVPVSMSDEKIIELCNSTGKSWWKLEDECKTDQETRYEISDKQSKEAEVTGSISVAYRDKDTREIGVKPFRELKEGDSVFWHPFDDNYIIERTIINGPKEQKRVKCGMAAQVYREREVYDGHDKRTLCYCTPYNISRDPKELKLNF